MVESGGRWTERSHGQRTRVCHGMDHRRSEREVSVRAAMAAWSRQAVGQVERNGPLHLSWVHMTGNHGR